MGYNQRTWLSWGVRMEASEVEVGVSVRNNTPPPQKHGEYTSVLAADLTLATWEVALVQELVAEEFPL